MTHKLSQFSPLEHMDIIARHLIELNRRRRLTRNRLLMYRNDLAQAYQVGIFIDQMSGSDMSDSYENCCKEGAYKLRKVLKWMREHNCVKYWAHDWVHSQLCVYEFCTAHCRMFQRVHKHVLRNDHHPCYVKKFHTVLLNTHAKNCRENCGIPECPIVRWRQSQRKSRSG